MDDTNPILKAIGQRVRSARLAKKMSQEDLAFEAKIGVPNVSDIELGKAKANINDNINVPIVNPNPVDNKINTLPIVTNIFNVQKTIPTINATTAKKHKKKNNIHITPFKTF